VMGLMNDAVKAKTHEAERTDHRSVEFVKATTLPKQSVGSFVQTDQRAMHQMGHDNHEQRRQPDEAVLHCQREQCFREDQAEHKKLKGAFQYPMRLVCLMKIVS